MFISLCGWIRMTRPEDGSCSVTCPYTCRETQIEAGGQTGRLVAKLGRTFTEKKGNRNKSGEIMKKDSGRPAS